MFHALRDAGDVQAAVAVADVIAVGSGPWSRRLGQERARSGMRCAPIASNGW